MKLYNVPRGSKIKVIDGIIPPGGPLIKKGEELEFDHIDGMYSVCYNLNDELVHLAAFAEVEILK